jgi:WS/DGAT/MGAT family acyltransferase
MSPVIDRLGTDDLVQLAVDVGPVREQVGALLVLDGPVDAEATSALLARRLASVPRLRQVVRRTPPGCGRPVWLDQPGFDPAWHVRVVACRPPGDEDALLEEALAVVTAPLPRQRPLWRAAVVTGLVDERVGVVVAFHHVVADGIGGLAVLGAVAEGDAEADERGRPATAAPCSAPAAGVLAREAWAERGRAVAHLPDAVRTLAEGLGEMRAVGRTTVAASSLNRRTGPRRRAVVARVGLDAVHTTAHRCGATINDVVLAAVGGALGELVVRRGEAVPVMVASVPVARRTATSPDDLGNALGGMTVPLSIDADREQRLRTTAERTGVRKAGTGAAFGAVVAPAFRLAAALGIVERYIGRQRTVTTFVSDLVGPVRPVTLGGAGVLAVLPLSHLTGNVTVTFAAMSYAGTLAVTVTADPDACPDLDVLGRLLQTELDAYSVQPDR